MTFISLFLVFYSILLMNGCHLGDNKSKSAYVTMGETVETLNKFKVRALLNERQIVIKEPKLFGKTVVYINNSMCSACVDACFMELNILNKINDSPDYKIAMNEDCFNRYKNLDFFQGQLKKVVVIEDTEIVNSQCNKPFIVLFDRFGVSKIVGAISY